jgi:hypothetical protein
MRNNLDHARQWRDDKLSELERLCRNMGLRAEFLSGAAEGKGWDEASHNWRVKLTFRRRTYACDFFGGAAVTNPSVADVVSSLVLDCQSGENPDDFDDLCDGMKCSEAVKLWRQVEAMAPKIRAFLGDDFDKFAEAEH